MNNTTTPAWVDASALNDALTSTQEYLPALRKVLKEGKQSLLDRFKDGDDIETLIHDQAHLIDVLLAHVWNKHFPAESEQAALIAVGGYGRGELHPGSDIDLLLLFDQDSIEPNKEHIEGFLTLLWDIGLEVGQSVRTIDDCVEQAKQDITVITNLIEARLLCGSEHLFNDMLTATGPDKIWPSDRFFAAKSEEQHNRHSRFGDTSYKLEPNIKENAGGLRDIQMVGWITRRHFGVTNLHDLNDQEFLTEEEHIALAEGRRLLWKIRFALHMLSKRSEDRLLFDYQKTIALSFGYNDGEHNLAVEQFMRQYYRTVMELDRLNEMLLQLFNEVILQSNDSSEPTPLNRRFQLTKGYIEVSHEKVFEQYPYALLEVFLLLQMHPEAKGVRASTIRLIRASLHLMNDEARNDLRSRSIFMEIMRQPNGITHQIRRMNRYGVLEAYLPAFANIVGRMQYDLFHHYTVDEHILFVLRNLRRFTVKEFSDEFPLCSELINKIAKPELLYLAGLYHDIAKGRGGDHSELGEQEAISLCQDHGLGQYDTNLVAWLVKNHLVMSMTAQRKDITDHEVIAEFAEKVGDQTHLDYIYLLTVADIRGTSPDLWNSWKDSLLKELYKATKIALRDKKSGSASQEAIINSKKTDVHKTLNDIDISAKDVDSIFANLDDDYLLRYSAEEIIWHIQCIIQNEHVTQPLICIRQDNKLGSASIFIYGPIVPHMFASVTATLERAGLTVVDARIISSTNQYTLDTYQVLENSGENISDENRLQEIKLALEEHLSTQSPASITINRRIPRQHKHFKITTRISASMDEHNQRTILDVITADRPGVLSRIGEAFRLCNIELQNARITTLGMRIEDVFYITNDKYLPLTEEQFQRLRDTLMDLLDD